MNVTNSGNLNNKLKMNDNELELPEDFEAGNVSADNVEDVTNDVEFSGNKAKSFWVWIIVAVGSAAAAFAAYYYND